MGVITIDSSLGWMAFSRNHLQSGKKKKKKEEEDPGGNLEEEYQHVRNAQKNRIIPKRLKNGQRSRKTSRKAKAELSYRRRQ